MLQLGVVRRPRICYNTVMNTVFDVSTLPDSFGAEQNIPLSDLTSFHVGGPATCVFRPTSYEAIREIVQLAAETGTPLALLGKGTNILASDEGFDGWVIRFDKPMHEPIYQGTTVIVCCGTSMTSLARETVRRGLMGMECLCGIPGTVGGACAMNAGAYGGEIKQILKRIRILKDGVDQWVAVADADLGYRRSAFTFPNAIALEAEFELKEDDGTALPTMLSCIEKRREKQPLELPSAGSTFKRPQGHFAGALIEQCGLKGYSIGGAQVSEKHAGFIVNTGNATASDILKLISHVQNVVSEQTGMTLELEIKRI